MIVNRRAEHWSALFLKWIVDKYRKERIHTIETKIDQMYQVRPPPGEVYKSVLIKPPGGTYDEGWPIKVYFHDLEKVYHKKWIAKIFGQTDHKIRERCFKILIERRRLYEEKRDGMVVYIFDKQHNLDLFYKP
jgi:hypothetical protein